jgi:hypothetical protein
VVLSVRSDLIISLDGIDTDALLEFWRWLLPDTMHPWFVTALGDLFLRGTDGRVWWLDVGSGELKVVAHDERQFRESLRDTENSDFWFGEALVDQLREAGISLRQGECYSYQLLPMLGGEYKAQNFRVYDVVTHFRVWGPIHEKLKDVPDGAQVEFVLEKGPGRTKRCT